MRNRDLVLEKNKAVSMIKEKVKGNGFEKAIIGLSGGIDSAVSAALAVEALGKENVYGIMLPYRLSNPASLNDAIEVAKSLDIETTTIDISPMVDGYFDNYDTDADSLRRGNRMARERMCVLYDFSAKMKGLVIGTGNKSELLIGYFTQYGDGACAFEPIGHLYKTEIFQLAKLLNLPDCVIAKNPTADLWEGQTDEEEMGISYANLDKILMAIHDDNLNNEDLAKMFSKNDIEKVWKMIKSSAFKRQLPSTLEEIWL